MAKKFEFVIENEEEEDTVERITLGLQESDTHDNGVDLVILGSDGDMELYILSIKEDGVIFIHEGNNFAGHKDEDDNEVDHLHVEFG